MTSPHPIISMESKTLANTKRKVVGASQSYDEMLLGISFNDNASGRLRWE